MEKTKLLTIIISLSEHNRFKEILASENRQMSAVLRSFIKDYIKNSENKIDEK